MPTPASSSPFAAVLLLSHVYRRKAHRAEQNSSPILPAAAAASWTTWLAKIAFGHTSHCKMRERSTSPLSASLRCVMDGPGELVKNWLASASAEQISVLRSSFGADGCNS